MKSAIVPNETITESRHIITVAYHNQHARIFVEKVNDQGNYYIWTADFVPADKEGYCCLYGANLSQLFFNGTCSGAVKCGPVTAITQFSRDAIFEKFKLEQAAVSWIVKENNSSQMTNQILYEKSHAAHTPKFNIKGYNNCDGAGHNCCSWVIEKLQLCGITLKQLEPYINENLGITSFTLPSLKPIEKKVMAFGRTIYID